MVKNHSERERGNLLPSHGLLFRISRVLLYAPSHRQNNTYHSLCYTSHGALAGTSNSSIGSTPLRINPTTHSTMSECSYHGATSHSLLMIDITGKFTPFFSQAFSEQNVLPYTSVMHFLRFRCIILFVLLLCLIFVSFLSPHLVSVFPWLSVSIFVAAYPVSVLVSHSFH